MLLLALTGNLLVQQQQSTQAYLEGHPGLLATTAGAWDQEQLATPVHQAKLMRDPVHLMRDPVHLMLDL